MIFLNKRNLMYFLMKNIPNGTLLNFIDYTLCDFKAVLGSRDFLQRAGAEPVKKI